MRFDDIQFDAALVRGLTQPRISRRRLLRGAGAVGLGSVLAACGIGGTGEEAEERRGRDWEAFWARQEVTGELVFANWPLYIDTKRGEHPSLDMFTEETGIAVEYKEVIQNNAPFYARIEPSLREGEPLGFDIIVLTNGWYLTQLIENGWLLQLDHSTLPNFAANAGESVKDPFYDPGNKHTLAWQSGMTGIGYDPRKTGREITSVQDLFDPAFEGHVGMMSDNTELGSVALLAAGVNPGDSTPDDWQKAADLLEQQRDDGIVRQYYDQAYIKALRQGDVWLTQAWSGDIFQSQNSGFPHLEFVVPEEGAMFWTDNMMIPLGAEHPADALEWMNFYYQPDIAAIVADWVWYICPVPAAKEIIATELDDPTVANSPLVFPTQEMEAQLKPYPVYSNFEEFDQWNKTFDPIIQA